MKVRVAEYIASHLDRIGVRAAFLLSGGMMMHLMDALSRRPNIRYYCHHHEQAAAMAADAYARYTGKLGLCLATSGPGATNLVTGITGAWQDSSPVLFLTGQSKLGETIEGSGIKELRQFGVFEVNIVPVVHSITKYAVFLREPATVRYHLERAIHLATTGRPGPVLLDIPLDIQGALVDPDELIGFVPEKQHSAVDRDALAETAAALEQARRPLILAGQGVRIAGAAEVFRCLVHELNVPVVTTQMAKDLVAFDDPLFIGHPGHKGDRAANFAVQSADFLLSVGASLHIQTTGYNLDQFAPLAKKIMVELDPAIRARENCGFTTKIAMDARAFLEELEREEAKPRVNREWRERCLSWKKAYAVRNEPHEKHAPGGPANLYEVIDTLSGALCGDETLVIDAGQPYFAFPQVFRMSAGQRYLVSGSLGAMGVALPFSIGAAVAQPGSPVICVSGDGSFHLNIQELETVRHNRLNIKFFVIDNDGYASIRATQRNFFAGQFVGSTQSSGVTLPPLRKLADAYGIRFIDCPERRGLRSAIFSALETAGPAICAVKAIPDQAIIPSVPSVKLADGRMCSGALHQMAPPLPPAELAQALSF